MPGSRQNQNHETMLGIGMLITIIAEAACVGAVGNRCDCFAGQHAQMRSDVPLRQCCFVATVSPKVLDRRMTQEKMPVLIAHRAAFAHDKSLTTATY